MQHHPYCRQRARDSFSILLTCVLMTLPMQGVDDYHPRLADYDYVPAPGALSPPESWVCAVRTKRLEQRLDLLEQGLEDITTQLAMMGDIMLLL